MEKNLGNEIISVIFPSGIEYSRLLASGGVEVIAFLCLRELRYIEICTLEQLEKDIITADLDFFRTQIGRTIYLMRGSKKAVIGSSLVETDIALDKNLGCCD